MSRENPGVPEDRLPPPAFPPGSARAAAWRDGGVGGRVEAAPGAEQGFPADALILPDDPLRPEGQASTQPEDPTAEASGIGGQTTAEPPYGQEGPGPIDPARIAGSLEGVARVLREADPSRLLAEPGTTRFEAALRGFVAGYLRGPSNPE